MLPVEQIPTLVPKMGELFSSSEQAAAGNLVKVQQNGELSIGVIWLLLGLQLPYSKDRAQRIDAIIVRLFELAGIPTGEEKTQE